MRTPQLVIFDLDGTLLYTIEDLADSLNYMLGEFSFPKVTTQQVFAMVGNGVENLVAQAVPQGKQNPLFGTCLSVYKQYYKSHSVIKTRPYDGVVEAMGAVRSRGIRIGILSNKFHEATEELCQLFFAGLYDIALGESASCRRKPSPDGIFRIAEAVDVPLEETILVGDSETDIATAQNAGIKCLNVLWGYRTKEHLAKAGGTWFVTEPHQIVEEIKKELA